MAHRMLSLSMLLSAAEAASDMTIPCDFSNSSISGRWADPRHLDTPFTVIEELGTMTFTVAGPWPGGLQRGAIDRRAGNVTLVFAAIKTVATGQLLAAAPSASADETVAISGRVLGPCDFLDWTDQADRSAGNTWCRLGSSPDCTLRPPAPPPPSPANGAPYPPLGGGGFTGASAPASPDPLVRYRWGSAAVAAQKFQQYRRAPARVLGRPPPDAVSGASSLLRTTGGLGLGAGAGAGAMMMRGPGSVGFDFGSECAGWLEFKSPDLGPAGLGSVLLSSSEFNEPQFTTPTGAANNFGNCTRVPIAVSGVNPGWYRLSLNSELYEGLRYGWLHVLAQVNFTVTNFTAVCQVLPINYADNAFVAVGPAGPRAGAGGEPEPGAGATALEEVWYTAMYTTRVDLLEGGFGSILMDRGDRISWTGDAHLAQKAALAGFGGDHGAAMVRANTDRTKGVDNGIISYDLYFVLSAVDYFMHTGDAEALKGWAPLIESKFQTATNFWAAPHRQSFCGSDDRIGADFETTPASEAEKTRYYKMLSVQTAREYAVAIALCGPASCGLNVTAAAAALDTEFTGYFERERPLLGTEYGMHAAAGAVLTGLTTAAEEQAIFTRVLSNPAHICSFSPFNTYFVLDAVSRLRLPGGRRAAARAALAVVRRCYHGMNRLGATTYWETFSPEWTRLFGPGDPTPNSQTGYMSHCHPWASGAAPWLTSNVVGVNPIAAGWVNFTVAPFLDPVAPNLLTAVQGTQPLPGDRMIEVRAACNGSSALTIPPGTHAVSVALPLCGADPAAAAKAVMINGKPVPPETVMPGDDAVVLKNLGPGRYSITIGVGAVAPAPPALEPAPASYRDRFVGADHATGGNWRSVYGVGGYYLWSYSAGGADVERLPSSVTGIKVNCPFTGVSGRAAAPNWCDCACGGDRRALSAPPAATGTAAAAARAHGCSAGLGARAGGTTATIDVSGAGALNVSLYLVDWDRLGRRVTVELRELGNLQLAAPTQYVANFTEGVYLSWNVELPVRLRLMEVQGPLPNNNALLVFSALFFSAARGSVNL